MYGLGSDPCMLSSEGNPVAHTHDLRVIFPDPTLFLISLILSSFPGVLFGILTRKLALYLLHSATHFPRLPLFRGIGRVKQWEDREEKQSNGVSLYSLGTTSPSERNVSFPLSFRFLLATLLLLLLLPLNFLGAMA